MILRNLLRAGAAAVIVLIALASAFAASPLRRDRPDSAGQAPPAAARPADLVIRGGKIVTVDDARPEAAAMAVNGDTIVALGSEPGDPALRRPGDHGSSICKGALATPGFIDAHVHFTGVGEAARNLKLATAQELGRHRPDGRRRGEEGATGRVDPRPRLAPGEVVRGAVAERRRLPAARGAEPRVAEQPGVADARQRPRGLRQRAGDEDGRSARGRRPIRRADKILRDQDGNPTGLFNERAQSLIGDALARDRATRTPAQVEADLRKVIELASQRGAVEGADHGRTTPARRRRRSR